MSDLEKQLRNDKAVRLAAIAGCLNRGDHKRAQYFVQSLEVLNRLITIEAKGTL